MKIPRNSDYWFEIDVYSNAIDSLVVANRFLRSYPSNFKWKWAANASCHSLYCLAICSLEGGNYNNVLDYGKLPKAKLQALHTLHLSGSEVDYREADKLQEKLKEEYKLGLIGFNKAIERIVDDYAKSDRAPFRPMNVPDSDIANVKKLREDLRNRFEHFVPIHWAIAVPYFFEPIRSALLIIEELVESGALVIYGHNRLILRLTKSIRNILDREELEVREKYEVRSGN